MPPGNPDLIHIDDRRVRLLFVPLLGLGIARLTGLYSGIGPWSPAFWTASAYFILVSYLIWEGNRRLWAKLRGKPDWLERPLLRLLLLSALSLSYTTSACVGLLLAWKRLAGVDRPDWRTIEISTLATIAAVAF